MLAKSVISVILEMSKKNSSCLHGTIILKAKVASQLNPIYALRYATKVTKEHFGAG